MDDALQVRHSAAAPVLEVLTGQETHLDQHLDGRHDRPAPEKIFHRVRDARVQRILPIIRNGGLSCHRCYFGTGPSRIPEVDWPRVRVIFAAQ